MGCFFLCVFLFVFEWLAMRDNIGPARASRCAMTAAFVTRTILERDALFDKSTGDKEWKIVNCS